ncbi:MCPH1, partial [Drosophila busckii]
RSPMKNVYCNFDVPHAEQSIITAEERNVAPAPTLSDILKDVIVYVEVRTGNDNRSEGVKSIIAKLGAQVNDRLLRNTTHVVFKDGLLSTYKRAQSWSIPIVSILWIEACKVQRRLCEPEKFPISNMHKYEYPELYGKLTRVRCIQPDSELNRRPRKRPATPTGAKDNESAKQLTPTTPKNAITRFFKPLSQSKLANEPAIESPATLLLNRISSGCFTPAAAPQTATDTLASGDDKRNSSLAPQCLNFSPATARSESPRRKTRRSTVEQPAVSTPPVRSSTRRRSSLQVSSSTSLELSVHKVQSELCLTRRRSLLNMNKMSSVEEQPSQPPAEPEPRLTRRRSCSQLQLSVDSTPKLSRKPKFQSICEEQPIVETPPTQTNQTNYAHEPMDIMQSAAQTISQPPGRRTIYSTHHMDISKENDENTNPDQTLRKLKGLLANVTTQTSDESFVNTTPLFSSTRLPGGLSASRSASRRSLFNVDMDLINERIHKLNNTAEKRKLELANDAELGQCHVLAPLQAVAGGDNQQQAPNPDKPKMRRLFTPNEEVIVSPPQSSKKSRKSISQSSNSSGTGSSVKRRRTLAAPVQTLKPLAAVDPNQQDAQKEQFITPETSEGEQPNKPQTPKATKRAEVSTPTAKRRSLIAMVHTNMHRDQVQVIHKTIRKLRGVRLDPAVTKSTTHLVSLEPRRTLNLLRGLMRGVWILSYKWVLDSLKAGKWLNEEPYELTVFSRAVEICRAERQAFGISYRCELFRYMETFYVSSLCRPITFNNVKELLLLGSAKLTENRYKAKFIIGDKRRAEDDRIYLSPVWVLDSITAMQVQKFGKYFMKSAIVTPHGIRYENPPERETSPLRKSTVVYRDPALVLDR